MTDTSMPEPTPMDEFNNLVPIAASPAELVTWDAERWRRQAIAHYIRIIGTNTTSPEPNVEDGEIANMISASRFCLDMAVHRQSQQDKRQAMIDANFVPHMEAQDADPEDVQDEPQPAQA